MPDAPPEYSYTDRFQWWRDWMQWVEHVVSRLVQRLNGLQRQHEEVTQDIEEIWGRLEALERQVGRAPDF